MWRRIQGKADEHHTPGKQKSFPTIIRGTLEQGWGVGGGGVDILVKKTTRMCGGDQRGAPSSQNRPRLKGEKRLMGNGTFPTASADGIRKNTFSQGVVRGPKKRPN